MQKKQNDDEKPLQTVAGLDSNGYRAQAPLQQETHYGLPMLPEPSAETNSNR